MVPAALEAFAPTTALRLSVLEAGPVMAQCARLDSVLHSLLVHAATHLAPAKPTSPVLIVLPTLVASSLGLVPSARSVPLQLVPAVRSLEAALLVLPVHALVAST